MSGDFVLEKVTAFVTRRRYEHKELLLFEHEQSGVQVPAGTVEVGEQPADAVTREVWEETGYAARILRLLGEERIKLEDEYRVVLVSVPLRSRPTHEAASVVCDDVLGNIARRGLTVRAKRETEGWIYVALEDYNLEVEPPRIIRSVEGWIPRALVSRTMHRTYFELQLLEETPRRWEQFAEEQYIFHLYWQALVPMPRLVNGQQQWLERFYEMLKGSSM